MTICYPDLNSIVVDIAELLRPSERLTVSEAAEKYRILNNPGSYVGPWKNATTPYMVEPMDTLGSRDFTSCVFVGPAQCGKALSLDTPLATPSGWTTMGALSVGDELYGKDGLPCRVTFATEVMTGHDCFRVVFSDGSEITADRDHKWEVFDTVTDRKRVVTTADMLPSYKRVLANGLTRHRYGVETAAPIQSGTKAPLDPYVFGLWLGDGNSQQGLLTCAVEDSEHYLPVLASLGLNPKFEVRRGVGKIKLDVLPRTDGVCRRGHDKSAAGRCLECERQTERKRRKGSPTEAFQYVTFGEGLASLGVIYNKHIPGDFLRASESDRWQLLKGMMDTDGCVTKDGTCRYTTTSERLRDGFRELVSSLGIKSTLKVVSHRDDKREWVEFLIMFTTYADQPCVALPRKVARLKRAGGRGQVATKVRKIVGIVPVESVPVRCIQVDALDHLFLAGRTMIPTHNTDALLLNWAAYNIICDPADMIFYQTSQATARDFSKRRIDRLHRHTPETGKALILRKDGDNIYGKMYRSGIMITLSWPSINEMSGRPVGRVALTDYDRMPSDIDGEGNPFDLAKKRTTTYRSFAMTLAESSPGHSIIDPKWIRSSPHEAPPCEGILALYNRGDKRRWVWPCPHCKEYFEGEFSMLEWPETLDVEEAGDQAKMRCPKCQELIAPEHKAKMNAAGQWIREGEQVRSDGTKVGKGQRSSMASFWMKGVAAAFASWKNLVVNFINAEREYERTGSEEALKSTINTDQGEVYFPRGTESLRTPEELKSRAEDWPEQTVPQGTRFLIATVDVQKNMWVVQVQGFGVGGDKYIVDRFDIRKSKRKDDDGDTMWVKPGTYLEDWDLIEEQVMNKTYPLDDDSGRRMSIKLTGCDSGGREGVTQRAYEFWRKLRSAGRHHRFRLLKGDSSPGAPRVRVSYPDSQRKDRSAGARGEIPIVMINTNILKDHLNNTLECKDMAGGRVSFPSWLPDNFFQELTAEIRTPKGWENPRGARNEAWDLMVYAEALWLHLGCENHDWDKPESWAKPWDENDLVFSPSENNQKFDSQQKKVYDLAKLAEALA